jgi:hypothetical protein
VPDAHITQLGGPRSAAPGNWNLRQIGGCGARRSFKAGPPRFGTATGTRLPWAIMDGVTEFLRSYLVPAGTGLAGDPDLSSGAAEARISDLALGIGGVP